MSIGTTLRNLIFVRKADPKTEPVREWLTHNTRAGFDSKVLNYPSTEVLAAYNGETQAYMPVKVIAVLDSVGFRTGITQQEATASMIELVQASVLLAHKGGIRELWFLTKDQSVATGALRMGFKELEDLKVLRLELP